MTRRERSRGRADRGAPAYPAWHSSIAYLALLVALVAPLDSLAADLHCGRDTDRNGSVDNYCAGKDADFDGYDSVADGGTDCDDTNWQVYPGMPTATGCSAGQAKMCQSDGSFTSCANIGLAHCPSGSLAVYYVDEAETDCSGTGTSYADPENYLCWFNTGMSGYHALTPGDCVIMLGGTYSDSWSSAPIKQVYSTIDGTASNPITLMGAPGESVLISGAGSSPNIGYPVYLSTANYWKLINFEVDGNFTPATIYINDSDNVSLYDIYARDMDSTTCGSDNCAGIKADSSSNNLLVRSSQSWNNYNRAAPTNDNNSQVNIYRSTGSQFLYNVFGDNVALGAGDNFFWKHGDISGDAQAVVRGNVFSGGHRAQFETAVGGLTIDRNVFLNPNIDGSVRTVAIMLSGNGSGATYVQGATTIENNTVASGNPLEVFVLATLSEQMQSPVTVNTSTDVFTAAESGFFPVIDLEKVMIESDTTLPAPLVASTYYYVIYETSDTFRLATSLANAIADTAIDVTTAGTGIHKVTVDPGIVTVRKNIFIDNYNTTYSADGSKGFFRICHYCLDTAYDMLVDNDKLAFSANGHYNSNGTALYYTLFGDASGTEDLTYSTYANWIAAGIETGSVNADPALDADNVAQHASMADWGWRTANEVAAASGGGGGGSGSNGGLACVLMRTR